MLMLVRGWTAAEAFDALRETSQHQRQTARRRGHRRGVRWPGAAAPAGPRGGSGGGGGNPSSGEGQVHRMTREPHHLTRRCPSRNSRRGTGLGTASCRIRSLTPSLCRYVGRTLTSSTPGPATTAVRAGSGPATG
ncbi:ANTAR domain-containing protein [Saccharothrix hoggarensis]|uniref:ANTAR domain-containing protein n=1 Tax=Saccharothrix hoggarensis TaxID=913853 RepID=A0ABW3QSN6_9PSEU